MSETDLLELEIVFRKPESFESAKLTRDNFDRVTKWLLENSYLIRENEFSNPDEPSFWVYPAAVYLGVDYEETQVAFGEYIMVGSVSGAKSVSADEFCNGFYAAGAFRRISKDVCND